MKSIFNKADNEALISRINKLTAESQPLWGKMDVSQMLAHITTPLLVMKGEVKINFTLLGMLFGKSLKKKYLRDRGFGKNLPTHTKFKVVDSKQFAAEQKKFIELLQELLTKGTAIITKNKHPFFGNMSIQEWEDMMYLHVEHHLKQFGV
ncbi:MAG TPA: DUF1569 domain-containing protein [Bacteroidia bacterium]|nr:DUF1569 domain-containing protein [Bacteroidia bacterium]